MSEPTPNVADAWDEGYRAAIEDYGTDIPWGGVTSDENPYLSAEERQARRAHPKSCKCLLVCSKQQKASSQAGEHRG